VCLPFVLFPFRHCAECSPFSDDSTLHGLLTPPSKVEIHGLAPKLSPLAILSSTYWTPLSPKEVEAYGESRCPGLDVLDLGGMSIELVAWD
jgi:hypothetical protein